jgi:DNA-binding NarL/FixJ family response regulator
MIRVLIVDDHSMVRAGLLQLLSSQPDIVVVGTAANGREAVEMAKLDPPDVVLMDLVMPGMDGLAATTALVRLFPRLPIIVLSTFQDGDRVKQALAAGAVGYLLKDVEPEVLVAGIRSAIDGGAPLSPRVAAQLLRDSRADDTLARLAPRERQILGLIAEGNSNKQIARLLGITEATVKSHCGRLFQHLGVTDRTQAAVWATRHLPRRES